ncbi:MAG: hypothetical protein JWR80_6691 [Bradyrhizobium sp.]|nr:hypothetical protein [Bradyrhizobium sp.]
MTGNTERGRDGDPGKAAQVVTVSAESEDDHATYLEYHGVAGATKPCAEAVERILHSRRELSRCLILTCSAAWNSEVGSKTLGVATFYLRAVCMNRNLWGVENFEEINIRHSKFAASRFTHEAAPALNHFADSSPDSFIAGIRAARERVVARKDEDREAFLRTRGFSKPDTAKIIATVLAEEGHPPASLYDFVQGITALARTKPHQDTRLDLEGKARRLLEKLN